MLLSFANLQRMFVNGFKSFGADGCATWAAAIAYYTLLSVFPLLLGVVAVAGLIVSDPQSQKDITDSLVQKLQEQHISGVDIGSIVSGFLGSLKESAPILLVFSILTTLWSGSNIFGQVIAAINQAWDVKKDSRNFITLALLRFLMMFLLGVLALAALAVTFIIAFIKANQNQEIFGFAISNLGFAIEFLLNVANFLLPFVITTFIFVIVYWLSPDRKNKNKPRKMRWKPVLLGAAITALIFQVAQFGLTFYITNIGGSGYTKTYGALAGLIIFLFFVFVSACIVLLGAEITEEADTILWEREQKAAGTEKAKVDNLVQGEGDPRVGVTGTKTNPLTTALGVVMLSAVGVVGLLRSRRQS